MEPTTNCLTYEIDLMDFRSLSNGSFRILPTSKQSKTIEFFDDLYTYPPKFRVKWDLIDDLHEDAFMSYTYRSFNQNLPLLDLVDGVLKTGDELNIKETKYSLTSYIDGYLNKITSKRFYTHSAKKLQGLFQGVPIYVILNGQGEIILANSTDSIGSNTSSMTKTTYDFCGSFDPRVDSTSQLGLFFMSKKDAEVYLLEIAKADMQAVKTFGLAVHSFGLDCAYRIIREYHPNIDFRFIPDLEEVQALLTPQNTGSSNFIFEDGQQQLRMRRRGIKLNSLFGSVNQQLFSLSHFLEKTEYFKGVPIYIVNVAETPTNVFVEQYQNTIGILDSFCGRFTKYLRLGVGFGNNWILQGSNQQSIVSPTTQTYIFFEKNTAIQFCSSHGRRVERYNAAHSTFFKNMAKVPKILVYNLEDFLECYEENLVSMQVGNHTPHNSFNTNLESLVIIPPKDTQKVIANFTDVNKKPFVRKVAQFFEFKSRRLMGFFEMLLNTK